MDLSRDDRYIAQVYARDPLVITGAEGIYLYDQKGKQYIDCSAHYSSCCLGHRNPRLNRAVADQLDRLVSVSAQFATRERMDLAEKLLRGTGGNFHQVLFGCTGSDAVEFALKAAKLARSGGNMISFWRGFHGSTAASAGATGKAETIQRSPAVASLIPPGFLHLSYPYCYRCDYRKRYPSCDLFCVDYIRTAVRHSGWDHPAAVILEPVQASGGVIVPPEGFFLRLRELCSELGALLLFDEVVTGIGRTGRDFAYQHWQVVPDILILGKALTGGYIPGSAVLLSRETAAALEGITLHGHTHSAYPLMCAAAGEVLKVLEEDELSRHSGEIGAYLIRRFQELFKRCSFIGDVRGLGLLIGLEIVGDREKHLPDYSRALRLYRGLREAGVIVELESSEVLSSSVLVLHPPLVMTFDQAAELADRCDDVFARELHDVCT